MLPLVFPLLAASSDVTDIIGESPVRAYRHGSAPPGVVAPYVTWVLISGVPENVLDGLPPVDNDQVQIDGWSDNDGTGDSGIEALGDALMAAIEPSHHVTFFSYPGRDPETGRYRFTMTATFWNHRQSSS